MQDQAVGLLAKTGKFNGSPRTKAQRWIGGNRTTGSADDPDLPAHLTANLLINNLQADKQYRNVRSMVKLEGG